MTTNQFKLLPITGIAATSTFAIFFLMQALVRNDGLRLEEPSPPTRWIDFIESIKPPAIRELDRLPPPPEPVKPPEMKIDRSPPGGGLDLNLSAKPAGQLQSVIGERIQLGFSDGERLPLVRVNPVYPRRALERGLEGSVVLEFTVTEDGNVIDAVVIEADPVGYFEKAALTAIQKYKYKPTIIDGKAYASKGERFRMVFELAGSD